MSWWTLEQVLSWLLLSSLFTFLYIFFFNIFVTDHDAKLQQKENMQTGHMWRGILRLEGAHGDPLTTAKLLLHRWGFLIAFFFAINLQITDPDLERAKIMHGAVLTKECTETSVEYLQHTKFSENLERLLSSVCSAPGSLQLSPSTLWLRCHKLICLLTSL